jgi:hypothetical protein
VLFSSHSGDPVAHLSVALCGLYGAPSCANTAAALALLPICCYSQVGMQMCCYFFTHHLFGSGAGAILRHRLCAYEKTRLYLAKRKIL